MPALPHHITRTKQLIKLYVEHWQLRKQIMRHRFAAVRPHKTTPPVKHHEPLPNFPPLETGSFTGDDTTTNSSHDSSMWSSSSLSSISLDVSDSEFEQDEVMPRQIMIVEGDLCSEDEGYDADCDDDGLSEAEEIPD